MTGILRAINVFDCLQFKLHTFLPEGKRNLHQMEGGFGIVPNRKSKVPKDGLSISILGRPDDLKSPPPRRKKSLSQSISKWLFHVQNLDEGFLTDDTATDDELESKCTLRNNESLDEGFLTDGESPIKAVRFQKRLSYHKAASVHDSWWSLQELNMFRDSVRPIAKRIIQYDKTYKQSLRIMLQNCGAISGEPSGEFRLLALIDSEARGLERALLPQLNLPCPKYRSSVYQVLDLQAEYNVPELLSNHYQNICRPAVKMAILLGQGDEIAARNIHRSFGSM